MTAHLVWYGHCDCYVWPIVLGTRSGRCGRCHTGIGHLTPNEADAVAQYVAAHGRTPTPIT